MLKTSNKSDEQQIELLLQGWAYATHTGLQDKILANHAEDVIVFDVLPPLKYEGIVAYKKVGVSGSLKQLAWASLIYMS